MYSLCAGHVVGPLLTIALAAHKHPMLLSTRQHTCTADGDCRLRVSALMQHVYSGSTCMHSSVCAGHVAGPPPMRTLFQHKPLMQGLLTHTLQLLPCALRRDNKTSPNSPSHTARYVQGTLRGLLPCRHHSSTSPGCRG
jgi:hypothetical protein